MRKKPYIMRKKRKFMRIKRKFMRKKRTFMRKKPIHLWEKNSLLSVHLKKSYNPYQTKNNKTKKKSNFSFILYYILLCVSIVTFVEKSQ